MVQFINSEKGAKYFKLKEIRLFLRSYGYSDVQGTFVACPAMPPHLPRQICRALDDLHLIDLGATSTHMPPCVQ